MVMNIIAIIIVSIETSDARVQWERKLYKYLIVFMHTAYFDIRFYIAGCHDHNNNEKKISLHSFRHSYRSNIFKFLNS